MTGAAPLYMAAVNACTAEMDSLAARMDDLSKAHDARLRVTFDPVKQREQEEQVEMMTAAITTSFNRLGRAIKTQFNAATDDQAELKVLANIKRGLATRLQEMSMRFRGMQREYMGSMQRINRGSSMAALFGGSGGAGAGAEERDEGFTDEQMHELATAEEDVDERMREIQRIARSVEELATMFSELSTLIVHQGTLLDRIDHNMEQALESSKKGVAELVQAEKYQKSARPIKCMLLLMVLIIICVIIIIAKMASKSN